MRRARRPAAPNRPSEPNPINRMLLQWASETGAHGMPIPEELERLGWHRLTEHPLFRGTWLMETPEPATAPLLVEPPPSRTLKLADKVPSR